MTTTLDAFEYRVLKRVYVNFALVLLVFYLYELCATLLAHRESIQALVFCILGTLVNIFALVEYRHMREKNPWVASAGLVLSVVNLVLSQLAIFFLPYNIEIFSVYALIYPLYVIFIGFFTRKIWIPLIFALLIFSCFICFQIVFPSYLFTPSGISDTHQCALVLACTKVLFLSLIAAVLICLIQQRLYESRQQKQSYIKRISNFDQETGLPNIRELAIITNQEISTVNEEKELLILAGIRLVKLEEMSEKLGYENMINWILRFSGELSANIDLWRRGIEGAPASEPIQLYRLETSLLIFPIILPKSLYGPESGLSEAWSKIVLDVFKAEHIESLVDFYGAITAYPEDGATSAELLNNLLNILHRITPEQKSLFIPFNLNDFDLYLRKERLKEQMISDSFASEVYAVFQPKVSIKDYTCFEFEALARWKNPILGLIYPGDFIPLAEQIGVMGILTKKILTDTKQFIENCQKAGFVNIKIAFNLSPSLISRDYLTTLAAWIVDNKLGKSIEIEITEGILLHTTPEIEENFRMIQESGVSFAIDDFGTGYSNLAYLQRFNAEVIKIDKCFIDGLPSNEKSANLIKAIILMIKAFGITSVAEGVENAAQLAFLRDNGCDMIQGYYFSKPLEAPEAMQFIENQIPKEKRL